MITEFPVLYHRAKNGQLRQWRTWSEGSTVFTEHGVVGGLMQVSAKTADGKNKGRSNETTPEEQAKLESKSLWDFKVSRKYSQTKEDAQKTLQLPMLAHSYWSTSGKKTKKASNFEWPGIIQPKYDGVRCLAYLDDNGKVILTSRSGREWHIPHISQELRKWLREGTTLDGEIWIPGVSCQKITSLAKSACPVNSKSYKPESAELRYYVYDIPKVLDDDTMSQSERLSCLSEIPESSSVIISESTTVENEKEMLDIYGKYVMDGHEGAVLRHPGGRYIWGFRSDDLLKIKRFQDSEFRVVDAREGRGKMSGCVVWKCKNTWTDGLFECTMKIPMEERAEMYKNRHKYIGELLTVRFFDWTDDELPKFPVGIVFRSIEDLSK